MQFDLQCSLEKIWHQMQSFLPDKGTYFENLCMYRSDTTCSWSKQVRVSCGWVGVRHCSAVPGAVPARPLLYTHTAPAGILYRRSYRHAVYYCTTRCRTRDAGDVWAAEETAGSRRHTHGGFKLSCCCFCMSDTQNCTSCLP